MKDWKNAEDSELVCYCIKVDKKRIVDAIGNGDNSLAKIKESTKACTVGNCKMLNPSGECCSGDINELIRIYSKSSSN